VAEREEIEKMLASYMAKVETVTQKEEKILKELEITEVDSLLSDEIFHKMSEKSMTGGKLESMVTSYERQLSTRKESTLEELANLKADLDKLDYKLNQLRTQITNYQNEIQHIDKQIAQAKTDFSNSDHEKELKTKSLEKITAELKTGGDNHITMITEETAIQFNISETNNQIEKEERSLALMEVDKKNFDEKLKNFKIQINLLISSIQKKYEEIELHKQKFN